MVSYGTKRLTKENVYPATTYSEAIKKSMIELTSVMDYIEKLEMEGSTTNILVELNKHLPHKNSIAFSAIGKIKEEKKSFKHEFQKYLAFKADEQFQVYLKQKGIKDSGLYITVSNGNTFPSKFVVMSDNKDVCYFDIFQHIHGRRSHFPLSDLAADIEYLEKDISFHKEKLLYYKNIKKNPFKNTNVFRDWFYLLTKSKAIKEGLDKKIKNHTEIIQETQEKIKIRTEQEPTIIANYQKNEEHFLLVDAFFQEINYERLPDRDPKLY